MKKFTFICIRYCIVFTRNYATLFKIALRKFTTDGFCSTLKLGNNNCLKILFVVLFQNS